MSKLLDRATVKSIGLPDRRCKLTPAQREEIRDLVRGGWGMREVARHFGVSHKLVWIIMNPEENKRRRENVDWREYYNPEKHRAYTKGHRHYKRSGLPMKQRGVT